MALNNQDNICKNQGEIMTELINVRSNVRQYYSGNTGGDLLDDKLGGKRNNDLKNIPVPECKNIPVRVLGRSDSDCNNGIRQYRRYTRARNIETLAVHKYRQNGRGISFKDLLSNGLAEHKPQAQATLKHCHRTGILFAPYNCKPQLYYPMCLRSEILRKIIPVRPTGVGLSKPSYFHGHHKDDVTTYSDQRLDSIVLQTLEGYVLPMLSKAPLHIHKMHFKIRISPECYQEIALPASPWNKGKEHEEIIGHTRAKYRFYANGTVIVSTESSNNPFCLATESDYGSLMAFLGQLRDRLVLFLADKHERLVPDIVIWELTQCDVNRDVRIEKWLQPTGLSLQVRHLSHLFRVYFKSRNNDIVCRIEESITCKGTPAVEAINNIFNPNERLEKRIAGIEGKIDLLLHGTDIVIDGNNPNSNEPDTSFFDNYNSRKKV